LFIKKTFKILRKIILLIILVSHQLFCQVNSDEKILLNKSLTAIGNIDFHFASEIIPNRDDKPLYINLNLYREMIETSGQSLSKEYFLTKIDSSSIYKENNVLNYLIRGYSELYYNLNNPNSFQYFFNAYKISKQLNNPYLTIESIQAILNLYCDGILQNNNRYQTYLEEFQANSNTSSNKIQSVIFEMQLLGLTKLFGSKEILNKLNEKRSELIYLVKSSANINLNHVANYRIANQYLLTKNYKKASHMYKNILKVKNHPNYFKKHKFNSLIKLSYLAFLQNQKDSTFHYLNEAKKYKNTINSLKSDLAIASYEHTYFEGLKNYDSAFFKLKKANLLQYKLSFLKSNELITQSEIFNKTEETKAELVLEERKKKNILLGAILTIGLGGIIGFLALKNSRKKQLLAEQQKELETQKNLTLLKEQELITINAMVDGQEKERTRIAEDLHDNLGSVLATLKLHFENLKFNKDKKKLDQEALFNKTENLIDEAYLKVRRIAHAKNAGVIASQGLLSSIQMMAEKISSADTISIEVVHYGLEKRLENSLEIDVFRIIQELITNTMKHANAPNATINLSQYDNTLTIIVEDNGIGFDIEKVDLTKSMGLHAIQTRITHLKGTLDIDSTLNKGTSIILNIPIA